MKNLNLGTSDVSVRTLSRPDNDVNREALLDPLPDQSSDCLSF